MKKIICLTAIFAAICTGTSLAQAAVRIEGESYKGKSTNITCKKEKNENYYSGGFAAVLSADTLTEDGFLTYKVTADEDGEYDFCGFTSMIGVAGNGNCTDYSFEINGRRISPKDYTYVADNDKTVSGKYFKKYQYPAVNLKAGENTVKVYFNRNDLTYLERKMSAYIDYFEFEKNNTEFSLNKFDDESNAFYNTDDVKLVIRTHNYATETVTYGFIAEDSEGIAQKLGSFEIKQGEDTGAIDLNSLPNGWYRIKIYNSEFTEYAGFETSLTISDKVEGLTKSFAVDTAGYILMNDSNFEIFRAYMKKAGIGTARDRTILGYEDYPLFQNFKKGYAEDGIEVMQVYDKVQENGVQKAPDFSEDLTAVYQKGVALCDDGVDNTIYEIFNEADGSYSDMTADLYSAYFKTISIAVSDTNPTAYKGFCGLACAGNSVYDEMLQQNDVMRYSDFYNYHTHFRGSGSVMQYPNESFKKTHIDLKNAYDDEKPIWVSEAGYYMAMETPDEKTLEGQAKFFVSQYVKSKILGEDRIFFFTLPNYKENGSIFGVFDENKLPRPVYATISEAAAMLGNAEYKGVLSGLADGMTGAMFNDGENDVAVVLAADGARYQFYTGDNARAVDFRGREVALNPTSSKIANIEINDAPLFIKFDGKSDERNYYPASVPAKDLQHSAFDFNERIVVRQIWSGDLEGAKENGYTVGEDGRSVDIEVYNFNESDATVTLDLTAERNFSASEDSFTLTVPANGKAVKTVTITTTDSAKTTSFLKVGGSVNSKEISPSVAKMISGVGDMEISVTHTFTEANNKSNWNTGNRGMPSVLTVSKNSGGGVDIEVDLSTSTTGGYSYPTFTVSEPEKLKGTDGICFDITSPEGNQGRTDIFLYTSGGAYHLGNYLPFVTGTKRQTVLWSDFTTYSGSTEFNPEDIQRIAIGVQGFGAASYTLRNISAFTADFAEENRVIAVSLENNKHYYDLKNATAVLPDKAYDTVCVKLDGVKRAFEYAEDGKIVIPLSDLERGYYRLQVIAKDRMNRADTKAVSFYVK